VGKCRRDSNNHPFRLEAASICRGDDRSGKLVVVNVRHWGIQQDIVPSEPLCQFLQPQKGNQCKLPSNRAKNTVYNRDLLGTTDNLLLLGAALDVHQSCIAARLPQEKQPVQERQLRDLETHADLEDPSDQRPSSLR